MGQIQCWRRNYLSTTDCWKQTCSPSKLRYPQCSRLGGTHDFLREGRKTPTLIMMCSSRIIHPTKPAPRTRKLRAVVPRTEGCGVYEGNGANNGTKSYGKARYHCEGVGKVRLVLVAHGRGEPKQQASRTGEDYAETWTVQVEVRTFHVRLQRRTKEWEGDHDVNRARQEMKPDTCKSSKIPNPACLTVKYKFIKTTFNKNQFHDETVSSTIASSNQISSMWTLSSKTTFIENWLCSILFDRTSILFVEQAVYRPSTPYLGALSTFACKMPDVVWSNQALLDLDDSYWDSRLWRIPSVCPCWNFVLPESILNLWWSVNWPHIQYNKCTRRNCSESIHCPVMKDQWDCVQNDLEELESKEFLVLTGQYSIEIFYCCLRLLPSCSSIHHQTNIGSTQICSEDHLSVSRIRSLHLLLEVVLRVEEECLFFLPLSRTGTVREDEQAVQGLLGVALALNRLCKRKYFRFRCRCLLLVVVVFLSIKSVTNLFKPWEILTHEWELSLFTGSILKFHSMFTL